MQLTEQEFDAARFIKRHPNDYIIFIVGGMNFDGATSYYRGCVCFQGQSTILNEDACKETSPYKAMLAGAIEACKTLKQPHHQLYLIAPTQLGFKGAKKNQGPNVKMIQQIFQICREKQIEFHDIDIFHGSSIIRAAIDKQEKELLLA